MEKPLLMRLLYPALLVMTLAACQHMEHIPEETPGTPAHTQAQAQKSPSTIPAPQDEETVPAATVPAPDQETATEASAVADDSLWPRFQSGLQLAYTDQPRVQQNIQWYLKNRRILEDSQQRMRYYLFFILQELETENVPFDVALIPLIESQYNPFASGGQPVGLWQFMPATGRRFHLQSNGWYDGRKDPVASTKAVAHYFQYLLDYFDNDLLLALAAYNSGEGTVQNAINKNRRQGKPLDYWHLDLPATTRNYIPKMLALAEIFRHPEQYQLTLQPISNEPYFASLDVDSSISLQQVSNTLGLDSTELSYLNAGIRRNARPGQAQYRLNIPRPADLAAAEAAINRLPKSTFIAQQHVIKSGESLGGIARKYQVSITELRAWNHLKSDTIVAGKTLLIANTGVQETAQQATTGRPDYHRVKNGESLWKIAQTYKVKLAELAQVNNKSSSSPLKIGERLIIP